MAAPKPAASWKHIYYAGLQKLKVFRERLPKAGWGMLRIGYTMGSTNSVCCLPREVLQASRGLPGLQGHLEFRASMAST
jgi:hypothetical protein